MIERGRHPVLGVRIDAVDYEAAVARIVAAARERRALAVTALAVHGVMTGVDDPTQRHRLNAFDLVVPDGQPVRWALNLLHRTRLADRVYGPDLTLAVCAAAAGEGLPVFLYGSSADVVARFEANLRSEFPGLKVAGARPSLFRTTTAEEKAAIVEEIRGSGAAITFVGLGCPRQEVFAYEYRKALGMPLLAVGAAFDFHAGTLPQAPARLQRWGLEWAFRLAKEPRRLWRRYVLLNPRYLALLALQATGLRRIDPASGTVPPREERYG